MNLYEKMQTIKLELSSRELKKSGQNNFAGYKYYELGDFLPSIIELCQKQKVFTQITFTENKGVLKIINCEKPEEVIEYESPLRELELKGANAIQALGGIETYLRRYLYMNAFDIVEADMFDGVEFEKKKKQKAEKNELTDIINMCKKSFTQADNELKTQVGNLMKQFGYASFSDITKAGNKNDILELANLLNVEVPETLKEKDKENKI